MIKNQKNTKQLERHCKGVANHRRIAILFVISKNDGIDVDGITENLGANFKTISQHTRTLLHAGLINKKHIGKRVAHSLSPHGKKFINFLNTF